MKASSYKRISVAVIIYFSAVMLSSCGKTDSVTPTVFEKENRSATGSVNGTLGDLIQGPNTVSVSDPTVNWNINSSGGIINK